MFTIPASPGMVGKRRGGALVLAALGELRQLDAMMVSRRCFLIVASVGLVPVPTRSEMLLEPSRAVALMQAGGLNLYVRHAITDRSQPDTGRRGDRAGQRNINARGRAQAAALGEAFRRLSVPVSSVSSSEVFRARDTAEIAFGIEKVAIVEALIADDYTPRDPMKDALAARQLLRRAPATGNAVFVGHIIPLGLILERSFTQSAFPEGAVALIRPSPNKPELIGIVTAEALVRQAGLAAPWAD